MSGSVPPFHHLSRYEEKVRETRISLNPPSPSQLAFVFVAAEKGRTYRSKYSPHKPQNTSEDSQQKAELDRERDWNGKGEQGERVNILSIPTQLLNIFYAVAGKGRIRRSRSRGRITRRHSNPGTTSTFHAANFPRPTLPKRYECRVKRDPETPAWRPLPLEDVVIFRRRQHSL